MNEEDFQDNCFKFVMPIVYFVVVSITVYAIASVIVEALHNTGVI